MLVVIETVEIFVNFADAITQIAHNIKYFVEQYMFLRELMFLLKIRSKITVGKIKNLKTMNLDMKI